MATIAEQLAAASITDTLAAARTEEEWPIMGWAASRGTFGSGSLGWKPPGYTKKEPTGSQGGAIYKVAKRTGASYVGMSVANTYGLINTVGEERSFSVWLYTPGSGANANGYQLRLKQASSGSGTPHKYKFFLSKYVEGTQTLLEESGEVTIETEGAFALAVANGKLTMWRRETKESAWVQVGSEASDSTYTEGYSAIDGDGSNPVLNNFITGALVTTVPEFARVRRFKGEGGVRLSIGSCNRTEDITIMALVRVPEFDTVNDYLLLGVAAEGGATRGYNLKISGGGSTVRGRLELSWVDTSGSGEPTGLARTVANVYPFDSHWRLVVVRKSAGVATADFGMYDFYTQEWTWVESTTNGASVKAESQASGRVVFGEGNSFSKLKGYCCAGFIGAVKTRAEIEALVKKATLSEWKSAAVGLWFLDQETNEGEITDQTGNGANRVSGGNKTEVFTPERPPIPYYNEITNRTKVLVGGTIKSVKRWVLMNFATRQY